MTQKSSIPVKLAKVTREKIAKDRVKMNPAQNMLSTTGLVIAVPLVTFLLITFVFQSFQVSGGSMDRTLQNGDRLIVWKVPRTLAKLTRQAYVPARGDVIVFNSPTLHNANGSEKQLIKRVIALPGERVVIKDNIISVYNNQHPDGFNPDTGADFSQTIINPTEGDIDIVVGEGQLFVCGDNRSNSVDSRAFGPIASSDIIGRMALRILPLNKFGVYL